MITVLHYAPGFRSGGIESRLLDWYRNINREEIKFVLVKLNDEDDTENMKEFMSLGGAWYNLPTLSISNYKIFIDGIKNIFDNEIIDIVHVHDVSSGFFILKEAKRRGVKCRILHSRTTSYLPNESNVLIKSFLRKITPMYANHYFGCSVEAGKWGCGSNKDVVVIKNGIQADLFRYNSLIREKIRLELKIRNKKVIGYIGRISAQKNLPFLFDVFDVLSKESDDYVLLVVGEGDESIINNYYQNKEIPQNIIFVGERKNVWDYYMCMDVFCSPSLYEGFGTTAIESQATGLPTIISEGFPEIVKITQFASRLPIDKSAIPTWVSNIKSYIGKRFPDDGMKAVKDNGYCASAVCEFLYSFYMRNYQ